ncbi:MAG: hypothetical protein B6229_05725 [Spirochaetaceae bacterium 4572_7]|nr:MAG: hypothetical protein B6229_05725 [Spirochaetaceae bacterium 4572_7]
MKKLFLLVLFVLLGAFIFADGGENKRGFYLSFGGGPAYVSYTKELDDVLTMIEDLGGDRITFSMNLSLGYAVTDNLYAIGNITAYGDRIDKDKDYMQINTYLYAVGIKYFPFTTGLFLGTNFGTSVMLLQSNLTETISSEPGTGLDFVLGYDFDRTSTGFGLQIGIKASGYTVEDDTIGASTFFVNLVWK